jgi:hypothetical protein
MTTTERSPVTLEDAIYQLSLVKQVPDAELLDEFVRRYPEHATALTEFAVTLALDSFGDEENGSVEPVSPAISPAVSRAMSRFQNRLYEVRKAYAVPAGASGHVVENPFLSLKRTEVRSLVERLDVSTVFLIKMRDRQIASHTIPPAFERRVAEELKVPLHTVTAHFAAQAEIQQGARFNANQKPEVSAKQTFEEAVRGSGLTPEQQKHLLTL